ncbi:glycosyltransferase family 10 domain-containing protein [Vibrio ouci]|uniref:Fucosyltransferase C-terminal domain-containing protein n=1 Tax=Vibrio ouci TaxID=2499078 RepID=A0A4Y8WJ84_9VIBR|nr:glycosyltransferase family 10 [Vibrio ouci]TFH92997.1 hypothetical protein ELS82_03325 [Vibrio ouci]
MSSFHQLKQGLASLGFDLSTCDINTEENSRISLHFDVNSPVELKSPINYLILQESEVINPFGWSRDLHRKFDRVFTWNDELVDNVLYFKLNFSHKFPDKEKWERNIVSWEEKKLCTLISGNKMVKHKYELYSERVKAINWFQANTKICEFDFYGMGWDLPSFNNRYINHIIKRIPFYKVFVSKHERYRGSVENKNSVLRKYKFAICFENAKEIPGYITEKIFDCFFAGCVPIYYGAPNISSHIPKSCYVDFRDFSGYEELYQFIVNMPKETYLSYITSIEEYIYSARSLPFNSECFRDTIVGHIQSDFE